MCNEEIIAYFVETKDKIVFIENETFNKFFPNIRIITVIFNDYVKNNISCIMKKIEKKYCVKKYILSLFSSTIQDYLLPLIKKYNKSIFIATVSTAILLRKLSLKNLFFALESDNSFIDKWLNFSLLIKGTNVLLSDCSDNIYIQGIIQLVKNTGQIVICLNDMNTEENQKILSNASVIGCSTLNFENLLKMCNGIPKTYNGYITTLDIGPSTNIMLDELKTVIPPNTVSLTSTTPSTMMALSLNNEWVNSVKLNKSFFTDSYNVCVYTILNNIKDWEKLLIKSNLVKNDLFYVYGLCYYTL
jgi:hypothetical protein